MAAVLTPELQHILLSRMADGEFLSDIVKHPGMPGKTSIMYLRKANPEFGALYDQAKEMQADSLFEAHYKRAVALGEARDVAAERLAFDAAKWTLSKMAPKKYGDKIQQETTLSGSLDVRSLNNSDLDQAIRNEIAGIVGGNGQGKVKPGD